MNSFLLSAGLLIALVILVGGSFILAIGSFLENPSILRVFGAQTADSVMAYRAHLWSLWFLFLGGIPLVLGGATYWLLLQMSRKALSKREDVQAGSGSPSVPTETRLPEVPSTNSQWKFLAQWSALNILGWALGIVFAGVALFFLQSLEIFIRGGNNRAVVAMLLCLPLGAGIGIFQWMIVGKLGIAILKWTILTALGWSLGVGIWMALYLTVEHPAWFFSLGDSPFAVPFSGLHVIHLGLIGIVSMAGAVLSGAAIGSFQSILLRRFISRPGLWIRACILGFLIPAVLACLIYLSKSLLKKILFSLPFLTVQFSSEIIQMRWILVLRFCLLAAAPGISILTGRVLLKQSNIVRGGVRR